MFSVFFPVAKLEGVIEPEGSHAARIRCRFTPWDYPSMFAAGRTRGIKRFNAGIGDWLCPIPLSYAGLV